MQVVEPKTNLKKSANFKEIGFKIEASAKAFDIISSKLYTNPIQAILRELSCNAYDSHVEAGNERKPFDVKIPGRLNPTFSIRDFGTGLSPEAIVKVYTVVFQSNRTSSNEFIGGFGLGSKTPFAYSDMFTVTSFYNGMKYVFTAVKKDGIPTLMVMGEDNELEEGEIVGVPTEEPNGVLIEMAVQPKDWEKFQKEAKNVFKWFKIKPSVNVEIPKIIDDDNVIKEEHDYIVYNNEVEDTRYSYGRWNRQPDAEYFVKMGNVAYQFSSNHISNSFLQQGKGLVIKCDIGDVTVEASREGLHYDEKTIDFVSKKMEDIQKRLIAETEKKLSTAKNYYEACKIFSTIENTVINDRALPSFNGEKLSKSFVLDDICFNKEQWGDKIKRTSRLRIQYGDKVGFFIQDIKTSHIARITKYVRENGAYAFLIDPTKVDDFCKRLKIDKSYFKNVSTLPKPEVTKSEKKGKGKVVKLTSPMYSQNKNDFWEKCDHDLVDGGHYVKINFSELEDIDAKGHNSYNHPRHLVNLKKFLEKEGITVPEVHGIVKAKWDKIDKEWTCFLDFAKKEFLKIIKKHQKNVQIKNSKVLFNLSSNRLLWRLEDKVDSIPKHTQLSKDLKFIQKIKETSLGDNSAQLEQFSTLAAMLGLEQDKDAGKVLPGVEEAVKRVKESYDLVEFFPQMSNSQIQNYIKLTEKGE